MHSHRPCTCLRHHVALLVLSAQSSTVPDKCIHAHSKPTLNRIVRSVCLQVLHRCAQVCIRAVRKAQQARAALFHCSFDSSFQFLCSFISLHRCSFIRASRLRTRRLCACAAKMCLCTCSVLSAECLVFVSPMFLCCFQDRRRLFALCMPVCLLRLCLFSQHWCCRRKVGPARL